MFFFPTYSTLYHYQVFFYFRKTSIDTFLFLTHLVSMNALTLLGGGWGGGRGRLCLDFLRAFYALLTNFQCSLLIIILMRSFAERKSEEFNGKFTL